MQMKAEEWRDFPGVIHIPIGKEPPEPTIPKEDEYGNPLFYMEDGIKHLIREAYFTQNGIKRTYIQAVKIKSRKKVSNAQVRRESEETVRLAREAVRREQEELRERYKKKDRLTRDDPKAYKV